MQAAGLQRHLSKTSLLLQISYILRLSSIRTQSLPSLSISIHTSLRNDVVTHRLGDSETHRLGQEPFFPREKLSASTWTLFQQVSRREDNLDESTLAVVYWRGFCTLNSRRVGSGSEIAVTWLSPRWPPPSLYLTPASNNCMAKETNSNLVQAKNGFLSSEDQRLLKDDVIPFSIMTIWI